MHTEEPSTCVLAKKILNFLKRWLANLRRAFVGVEAQSAEAKAMLAHMDELQALWNRGLASAVDTYRRTNENTAEDGGVVQYENRGLSETEILAIQSIGGKSISAFTSADIKATKKFAQRYWVEMKAKSPFFRAWFGDWRENETSMVNIARAKGAVKGTQKNDDTGWTIQVSGKVFTETRVHTDSYNIAARKYLPYINDIIKKAVLLDSYAMSIGKAKSKNSLLMHSLYAVVDIGNGIEVLKLYVEEMNDPNDANTTKRAYQLQNIEKYRPTGKSSQKTVSSISPAVGSKITVADLFKYVKRLDKNFSTNPSSKIVNADGTPKVVYHGTDGQFTAFGYDKVGSSTGVGILGDGFYFTDKKNTAKKYGSVVMPVYLDIKNPYMATAADAYKLRVLDLKAKGYDGVVMQTPAGIVYMTFENTQIKSATDNIGTFDRNNSDVRYSTRAVDSTGRQLSEQQRDYFADSVVRDADGRLKVVYHGSTAVFTEFDLSFMGRHGSAEGQGIYFTDSKTMAEGYQNADGQLMEGYLLISKPLSDSKLTLTRAEVRKLLTALDPTGDDIVSNYDTSGMGYPSRAWYNRSMNAALDMLMDGNDTDTELMGEIANINGDTAPVLRAAREVLGYDGYIVEGKYEDATVYVAFESNQFKNRDNTTPTKSGDIRFSARDTTAITDREILAHTLDSAAQMQAEKTLLERYRAHAEELRGQVRTWERKYKEQTLSSPCEERVCLFLQIDLPFGEVIEGIGCGGNRVFHRAGGQQQRVALETDGQDRTLALQLGT